MSKGQPELFCNDVVRQRSSVTFRLHRLENVEAALHLVPDDDTIPVDQYVDRPGRVRQGSSKMAWSDFVRAPHARSCRFAAFVHDVGLDKLVSLPMADAVDDQLGWPVEDDLEIILRVRSAGEEGLKIEWLGRSGRRGSSEDGNCRRRDHWRPATSASTTVGSASVDVSPNPPVAPSAILRRIRRMILPDRVFGSAGVKWIFSGAASAPMSRRTSALSSLRSWSLPSSPAFKVTNA